MRIGLAAAAIAALAACAHGGSPAAPAPGFVSVRSAHSVSETVARLEAALAARDIKVMAKVDHGANAKGVGVDLPPTMLLIFGNPHAGTQLMGASRTAGIDLPLKALVYEENGAVVLAHSNIGDIAARHGIDAGLPALAKIDALLAAAAAEATAE
jgi:uncharacterized protein (DUF302 family)